MVEFKPWHKFIALGGIIIVLTLGSYLVLNDANSSPSPNLNSTAQEVSGHTASVESIQKAASSNSSTAAGQVASSTAAAGEIKSTKDDNLIKTETVKASTNPQPPSTEAVSSVMPQNKEPTTSTTAAPEPVSPTLSTSTVEQVSPTNAQAPVDLAELEAWQQFKMTYSKNYPNSDEELRRQSIFNANRKFIMTFNERQTALFTLAVNQFADMTREEINQLYFSVPAPALAPPPLFRLQHQQDRQNYVDWRNLTSSVPVDQGTCRDSAIFAVTASIESAYNKKFLPPVNQKFSEQQLIDCLVVQANQPPPCIGGLSMVQVFDSLRDNSYILTSPESYKSQVDLTGQRCNIQNPVPLPPVKLGGYGQVHSDNMLEALYVSGPLCVTIDASQSTFHFYKSGLYHDENCSTETFNHHMVLIGHYSDVDGDSSRANYLLRNSFGPTWGDSGYMRLLVDEQRNKCLPQKLTIHPMLT